MSYTLEPAESRSSAQPQPTETGQIIVVQRRLRSLDIYRGLIMISLAFGGFGLAQTAKIAQERGAQTLVGTGEFVREIRWDIVQTQFSHTEWVGWSFWDMIQPSFMFMVGVSLAFSYAARQKRGDGSWKMLGHAILRSLALILLGIFLISNGAPTTKWSLMNVLTQIGLGYTFLFLFWKRGFLIQTVGVVAILAVTFAAYRFCPSIGVPTDPQALANIGVEQEWVDANLAGVDPWWHKNANYGHNVDLWVLNWLPQSERFKFNRGGYQTVNFVPALATMLLGLICGEWLQAKRSRWRNLFQMLGLGIVCIGLGLLLSETSRLGLGNDLCPFIKKIWSPSWALFSGGICAVTLAVLYLLFDILPLGVLAYPATVVGTNSLAMYCMSMLLKGWTWRSLTTHFGENLSKLQPQIGSWIFSPYPFESPPPYFDIYQPMCEKILVGLCFWLVCLWMHRQRLFVRL
jgi:heparan-alpha-glucosaminide N-acetyltransferase